MEFGVMIASTIVSLICIEAIEKVFDFIAKWDSKKIYQG